MNDSLEKKQDKQKALISTLKFFAAACPLAAIYGGQQTVSAWVDAPAYRRDCASATLSPSSSPHNEPCYYVAANATLVTTYDRRGRTDSQDTRLAYDGKVSEVETGHDPLQVSPTIRDPRLSDQSANGPCIFEVWHKKIVLITIKSGAKIQTNDNPALRAGPTMSGLFAALLVGTIPIWAYLIRHRSRSTIGSPTVPRSGAS